MEPYPVSPPEKQKETKLEILEISSDWKMNCCITEPLPSFGSSKCLSNTDGDHNAQLKWLCAAKLNSKDL